MTTQSKTQDKTIEKIKKEIKRIDKNICDVRTKLMEIEFPGSQD